MAVKEMAISKRIKITQAQEYMILAVLGASLVLGASVALALHSFEAIALNAEALVELDASLKNYTEVIESSGVCKAAKGQIYTEEELKSCDPDSIELSEIPGTLRSNILETLASNEALNSVQQGNVTGCINSETGVNYTYNELNELYNEAETDEALVEASNLLKECSALRIIPDALPSVKNQESLLASLNNIFLMSDIEPESLAPAASDTLSDDTIAEVGSLQDINVTLAWETDTFHTLKMLRNLEKSIREFNINNVYIEWNASGLEFTANATAYYINASSLTETTKTISNSDETK